MEIGEKFVPHPNLKKVYYMYSGLAAIIPLIVSVVPILAVAAFAQEVWRMAWAYLFIPLLVVLVVFSFVAYWVGKYCASISFLFTEDEVVVERGVWWRMKHVVPYARVMSVDVIQGPISRRFGLGSVNVHTAGYTGPAGGTAGPGMRGAEASIWGVQNFVEIRDDIIGHVRGRPLFGAKAEATKVDVEILEELKMIRKELAK
ncbi:MAG: PH domain-containing protein [Methanobacteriota archaeon]